MQLPAMALFAGFTSMACLGCTQQKMIQGTVPPPPPPPPPDLPLDAYVPAAPGESQATLDQNADRMLSLHNAVRAGVRPAPATPLVPLVWSEELAREAQAWADRCVDEHSSDRSYGENLYSRGNHSSTPEHVVASFAAEAQHYDYATNTCAAGEVCGHYTQIVWAGTTAVGCAVSHCETNTPFPGFPQWDFWVCRYAPPGNYVGKKPY